MPDLDAWIRLPLAALATWRVTHLIAIEDGPADVVVRLRTRLGDGQVGRMLDCFQCLSVWVAAPMALTVARGPADWLLAWLGLSGAACLLERMTEGAHHDGMLRSEAGSAEAFDPNGGHATRPPVLHGEHPRERSGTGHRPGV